MIKRKPMTEQTKLKISLAHKGRTYEQKSFFK